MLSLATYPNKQRRWIQNPYSISANLIVAIFSVLPLYSNGREDRLRSDMLKFQVLPGVFFD